MKWFKHKTNMRHDIKLKRVIAKYGLEGYGLYNLIIESIVESLETESPLPILQDNVEDIAMFYNANSSHVGEMVNYMANQGLFDFTENHEIVCVKVYKHIQASQTRSEQIRELIASYDIKQLPSKTVSDKSEEQTTLQQTRKEQTTIDYISTDSIIDYFNSKTGKHLRYKDISRKSIKARLNEGFTVDDCKKVIDVKYDEWDNTDYSKYIRISTLFGNKFEVYLNQEVEKRLSPEGEKLMKMAFDRGRK